jgi:hypothetical protein
LSRRSRPGGADRAKACTLSFMRRQSYPAARVVSERTQLFRDLHATGLRQPYAEVVEQLISAAFWASLGREEGNAPTISLALIPPEQVTRPLTFSIPLRLDPNVLVRLAPAVERPGIHLGVWEYEDELRVWGTTRTVPTSCFVLEVIEPGLMVVKFRRAEPSTKFANIAVLDGATVKFINQQDANSLEFPSSLRSFLTFYASGGREESDSVVVRLALSIRAHQRGGSLLIVPDGSSEWRASLVNPISYSVLAPFSEIESLLEDSEGLRSAIDALAGWTAVDGATVISDRYALLASGVKIVSRDASQRVEEILVTEPVEGSQPTIMEPSQLGNTRHLSAAQFVHDQRDAVALVASQDGRFTVFGWSASRGTVLAHRVESLLL